MLDILLPVISTPQFRSPVVKSKEYNRNSSTRKKSAPKFRTYIQPQKLNFDGVLKRSSTGLIDILFKLLNLERTNLTALEEVWMHQVFTPTNLFFQISNNESFISFNSFTSFIYEINLKIDSKDTAKIFKFLSKNSLYISQHDFEVFMLPVPSHYRSLFESRSDLMPSPRSDIYNLSLRNYFSQIYNYVNALEILDFDIMSFSRSDVISELNLNSSEKVNAKDIIVYFTKHSMEISHSDAVLLYSRGLRYSKLLPV